MASFAFAIRPCIAAAVYLPPNFVWKEETNPWTFDDRQVQRPDCGGAERLDFGSWSSTSRYQNLATHHQAPLLCVDGGQGAHHGKPLGLTFDAISYSVDYARVTKHG